MFKGLHNVDRLQDGAWSVRNGHLSGTLSHSGGDALTNLLSPVLRGGCSFFFNPLKAREASVIKKQSERQYLGHVLLAFIHAWLPAFCCHELKIRAGPQALTM